MSEPIRMPKPRNEAQRAAARANGAKSQGPTTPDGKAKSALNSLRHGLLAGLLVLRTESDSKFLAILNGYLDEYHPEGQTESAALVLLNRYAARHNREWHRAIDKLRKIQKERREGAAVPDSPLITRH